jgi:hypothetical protein
MPNKKLEVESLVAFFLTAFLLLTSLKNPGSYLCSIQIRWIPLPLLATVALPIQGFLTLS